MSVLEASSGDEIYGKWAKHLSEFLKLMDEAPGGSLMTRSAPLYPAQWEHHPHPLTTTRGHLCASWLYSQEPGVWGRALGRFGLGPMVHREPSRVLDRGRK